LPKNGNIDAGLTPPPLAEAADRAQLPPFASLLKSRDVEDPVNLWVHRPLAYGIVAAIYRSSITPNQITLIAMLVGCAAGICWFIGTPKLVVTGGALLWASSILDGADGILARAKRMQSEVGRALDGTADAVVGVVSMAGAWYYVWRTQPHSWLPWGLVAAMVTAILQIYMYDYYKEIFLHATVPGRGPLSETPEAVAARLQRARDQGAPWVVIASLRAHVLMVTNQRRVVRLTNPQSEVIERAPTSAASAQDYRRLHYGPMQLWALLSLCPHSYLLALSALFQRIDLYVWFRVFGASAMFLIVLVWQRIVTNKSVRATHTAEG